MDQAPLLGLHRKDMSLTHFTKDGAYRSPFILLADRVITQIRQQSGTFDKRQDQATVTLASCPAPINLWDAIPVLSPNLQTFDLVAPPLDNCSVADGNL